MKKRIYLSPPFLGGMEIKMVQNALESNWIAPLGPDVDAFEKEMASYLGLNHAVALSSGTSALHLALIILGIQENDHVFCSDLTFISSANVIVYEKAIPIFIDCDEETWNLSPDALERAFFTADKEKKIPKALIVTDLYGQSADYSAIYEICQRYNVPIIEDAAESLGAVYKNQKCGTFGEMGIISFNGNKIITTSGGGMLVSNNKNYIDKARFLATQAREKEIHYEHKELGYNYRMSNILAALGRGQLKVLKERVRRKREIFKNYETELSSIKGVKFMPEAEFGKCTRWLTTLTIDPQKNDIKISALIDELENNNIESRPIWKPMHLQPLYRNNDYYTLKENKSVSKDLFYNGICLPSGSNLSLEEQERVISIIKNYLKR